MNDITTTSNDNALVSFIERASRDPDFDVEKFGELLRLQRDMQHDQARRAFNVAMAAAQAEMVPAVRDAKNTHLGNKYATLEAIDRAIRPIYTAHGFSVRYGSAPAAEPGTIRVTCTVAHEGGYFEEQYLDAPVSAVGSQGGRMATTPVQAVGVAVTYLRRYLLCMVFNVQLTDDDDDGEAQRTTRHGLAPTRTDAQWRVWIDKLQQSCAVIYKEEELAELAGKPTIVQALKDAPTWAHDEIDRILENHMARVKKPAAPEVTTAEETTEAVA